MKAILLSSIILVISFTSNAQVDSNFYWYRTLLDTNANFFEIADAQNKYFSSHPDTLKEESGNRAMYYKWANFWKHRVANVGDNPGNFPTAIKQYKNEQQNIDQYFTAGENPSEDWEYLGPKRLESPHYGRIESLALDPVNPDIIYAGTNASGLWKTIDGGVSWQNITGAILVEGFGVTDILINPSDPDVIYLAIGFDCLGRSFVYGSGILQSNNGGETWTLSVEFEPSERKRITKLVMDPNDHNRVLAFGSRIHEYQVEPYIYRTYNGTDWLEVTVTGGFPSNYLSMCNFWWRPPKIVTDAIILESNPNTVYISTTGFEYTNNGECPAEVWRISNVFSNLSATDFTKIEGFTNNFCRQYMLDVKDGQNAYIYIGGVKEESFKQFSLYKLEVSNLLLTPVCIDKHLEGAKNDMFEFEMSDNIDGAFYACGYFMNYFTNNGDVLKQIITGEPDDPYNPNESFYHSDTRALCYRPDNENNLEILYIGNDGGVTKAVKTQSQNSVFDLYNINGYGLNITQFWRLGICKNHPQYYAGGTQDNRIQSCNYTGPNLWDVMIEDSYDAYEVAIHHDDYNKAFYLTGPGITPSWICKTLDGFNSNAGVQVFLSSNDSSESVDKPLIIDPGNTNTAYVGFRNIYKCNGWGENDDFTEFFNREDLILNGLIQESDLKSIKVAESDNDVIYAAYCNGGWAEYSCLIKTENATDPSPNWQVLDPGGSNIFECSKKMGITDIAIAPDNPDKIWISFGKFKDSYWPSRVYESFNGGSTFRDITSDVLPNVPFNCLKAVETDNSNEYHVFAGTDLGIYVYSTETETWTPFNNHLPPGIVTDIEYIPGIPGALRIATFGNGIWETLLDCSKSDNYEIITGPVTWSDDMVCHHNVYIASGGVLTITAKISFVEGTGLIVQEGGQLWVEDGTLKNACGSLWNGITVLGDPAQPITNLTYQGYCVLNNSHIENAIAGVRTLGGAPDYVVSGSMSIEEIFPAGGIIEATNTVFRNNFICVLISPNSVGKIDKFTECTFEVTSDLLPPYYIAGPLVKLNDVNKVYFKGCTFQTSESYCSTKAFGTGILSNNSTFYVDALCKAVNQYECTLWKLSDFENLNYGIKALASSPTRTFRADMANFTGNNTGIYASAVSTAQVTRSNFEVLKTDTLSRNHFGGLYLDFCTGYTVEDNEFNGPGGGDDPWAIGLIINNSNYGSYVNADNEIYNNNFNDLNIGILAQNKNRSNSAGDNGLTLKCNDFAECRYDIAVTVYNQSDPTLGIRDPQGQPGDDYDDPAGNIFSDYPYSPAPHDDYNYHNEGGELTYYHHDHENPPYSFKVRPSHYSTNTVTLQKSEDQNFYDPSECCLSHFVPGGGGGIEDLKALLGEYETGADSVSNLLTLLTDGGNTQQTNQYVVSSTPPEALEVYNDLMMKSPYLSDTVMVSAVNKETVLDAAMITEILTENPQAAKTDTVVDELENRVINPLSDDQMAEVMQGLYITGAKEALEDNLAGYRSNYSKMLNNIVRYYISDSLSSNPVDSILTYLGNCDYLWAKYHQAFLLNEKGDSAGVSSLMEAIVASYILSSVMITDHENYLDLLNTFKQCRDSSHSIFQIDSTQISLIEGIVQDSSGLTSIYASNLLVSLNELSYMEPYLLPGPILKESKYTWPKTTLRKSNSITIYPNPAGTYCVFEVELKDFKSGARIEIIDNRGRSISSLIVKKNHDYLIYPLDNLPSGLYLCTLYSKGKPLANAKLIVNK